MYNVFYALLFRWSLRTFFKELLRIPWNFFGFPNYCTRLYSVLHLILGENDSLKCFILCLQKKLRNSLGTLVIGCLPNPVQTSLIRWKKYYFFCFFYMSFFLYEWWETTMYNGPSVHVTDRLFVNDVHYQYVALFNFFIWIKAWYGFGLFIIMNTKETFATL